jgi:hypothetical protein
MVQIVPATMELLKRFYGEEPKRSQRAVVAIKDDRIIGVAGIYTEKERSVMFSEMSDECRKDKRTVVKGIRAVMKLASARAMPVMALADPEIEGSEKLLEHMGFAPLKGRVYQWQP